MISRPHSYWPARHMYILCSMQHCAHRVMCLHLYINIMLNRFFSVSVVSMSTTKVYIHRIFEFTFMMKQLQRKKNSATILSDQFHGHTRPCMHGHGDCESSSVRVCLFPVAFRNGRAVSSKSCSHG